MKAFLPSNKEKLHTLKQCRWSVEKSRQWYDDQPWTLGFNYIPGYAVNFTEMWLKEAFDPKTINRELKWAAAIGFNSLRTNMQFLVWRNDRQGLLDRFDRFLDIAGKHSLRVMPCHFDDCSFTAPGEPHITEPYLGKQLDPVPGCIGSSFTPSPGHDTAQDKNQWPELEDYVKEIITRYANDKRIYVWDLYNEPGGYDGMAWGKTDALVDAAFTWAREINPSQPLTVGWWSNSKTGIAYGKRWMECSDIITYHHYGRLETSDAPLTEKQRKLGVLPMGEKKRITLCRSFDRPVLCTEWLARQLGSIFETHLPLYKKENIGCFHWGMANGRSQCHCHHAFSKISECEDVWGHDLLHPDGRPYDENEIEFIKKESLKNDYRSFH